MGTWDTPPTEDELRPRNYALGPRQPPASATAIPPALTAARAAAAPSAVAPRALDLASKTSLPPHFVAENYDAVKAEHDLATFSQEVGARPVTKQWADQSPVHAAAVAGDMGPLGRIEGWLTGMGDAVKTGFLDIGHAQAMFEYMSGKLKGQYAEDSGPLAKYALSAEERIQEYDKQDHTIGEDIARAAPTMGLYVTAGMATGPVGVATLMYMQNMGVLARSIERAQPPEIPPLPPTEAGARQRLSDDEILKYAKSGSAIAAVTLERFLGPLLRSIPGADKQLGRLGSAILTRGASTPMGQAALKSILQWGEHSLSGALGMALQSSINNATVRKATTGEVDFQEAVRDGAASFVKMLPVAAAFGAFGPGRDFLRERGAITNAHAEQAKLDAMAAEAKKSKLVSESPEQAKDLFERMAPGEQVHIEPEAAKTIEDKIPDALLAEAEASQSPVAVPLSTYLTDIAPEHHEALREDVKLSQDGMTPREAAARVKEMPVLAGEPAATKESKPLHELMADEYGGTPEDWAKRLTPDVLEAITTNEKPGDISPQDHAARVIDMLPNSAIKPNFFERQAKKLNKKVQEAAEDLSSGTAAGVRQPGESPAIDKMVRIAVDEQARDIAKAKARRAVEVRKELDSASERMQTQASDDKTRARLNLAGGPLLHLFDALTELTGVSKTRQGWVSAHQAAVENGAVPYSPEAVVEADARMNGSLDGVLKWFNDSAVPVKFNANHLRDFLQNPRSWGQLTPPEARNIADTVKSLTTVARDAQRLRTADQEATVNEVATEIISELEKNPDKGLPVPSGVATTTPHDILISANAANAVMLRPKNNLRQKSAAAVKWIFENINQAVYARDQLARDIEEPYKEAWDNLPRDAQKRRYETHDLSDKLPVQGMQPMENVPRTWLWKLARHWGSAGNIDRVVSTSGWDINTLHDILFENPETRLSESELDYLQTLADHNEKVMWPLIRDKIEGLSGLPPSKVSAVPFKVTFADGRTKEYAGGYEPLTKDRRPGVAEPQPETGGIAAFWGNESQIPWTPGSVKDRAEWAKYTVNMDWDTGRANVSRIVHWLAFDQPVRDVAKLLNNQPLAQAMNRYMGGGRAQAVNDWLRASATRQADSVAAGQNIVAQAFGVNRKMALMSIVGASGRLAVAQLSHPFGLMTGGEVNPVHGVPALLKILKPFQMENGEVKLMPTWQAAFDHGKEVQHRADRAYMNLGKQLGEIGLRGDRGPVGRLQQVAQATAGLYLHAVDRITTTWAWTAFHNEAVSKFKYEPFSKEACDYANGRTQDVMPVHDIETAAPVLTNKQLGGFLIMHGFKNTLYNMRADSVNASIMDFHQAEGAKGYAGAIAKTAGRVALQAAMFGGFAIMGKMALGHGQQDDETKGQWLARDAIGGQSEDLPLIGGLGEPIAKMLTGGTVSRRDFTLYGNPGIAAVEKAYELVGNLVNGGRETSSKVFDAVEAAAFALGAPSKPLRVTAEYLYNMLMGEEYSDEPLSFGRMFYTERQWESIKRSLSPDED